jgi:gp16 family phage-associated protein
MYRKGRSVPEPIATPAAALKRLHTKGVTIKDWALSNGFKPKVVYTVLQGRSKCLRGESHHVAVALGLKPTSMEAL